MMQRVYSAIILFVAVIAIGPFLAVTWFGYPFLPFDADGVTVFVTSALGAAIGLGFVLRSMSLPSGAQFRKSALVAVPLTMAGWALLVTSLTTLSLPMMHAAYVAEPVERVVRVSSLNRPSRSCDGALDIQNYIILHICKVAPELKNRLTRGGLVVLTGTGSSLGIFYTEMAKKN